MEVTENSPLNETTGVSERKPTSWITGTRRPDDNEAHGSGPLQSQLKAGILLGILAFILAILLRSGAPANLAHEVLSIDGATANPYANLSTNFDEQKIIKLSDSRLPRSRLEMMRASSLLAGAFKSLWPDDTAQLFDNALSPEMVNWAEVKGDLLLTYASSSLCAAIDPFYAIAITTLVCLGVILFRRVASKYLGRGNDAKSPPWYEAAAQMGSQYEFLANFGQIPNQEIEMLLSEMCQMMDGTAGHDQSDFDQMMVGRRRAELKQALMAVPVPPGDGSSRSSQCGTSRSWRVAGPSHASPRPPTSPSPPPPPPPSPPRASPTRSSRWCSRSCSSPRRPAGLPSRWSTRALRRQAVTVAAADTATSEPTNPRPAGLPSRWSTRALRRQAVAVAAAVAAAVADTVVAIVATAFAAAHAAD